VKKLLKQKYKKDALTYLLKLCQQESLAEKYEEILIEEFYLPYIKTRQACYAKNRQLFEEYPYFLPEFSREISELDFLLLQCDEEFYKYNFKTKQTEKILHPHPKDSMETGTKAGTVIFLKNYFHFKKIFKMEIGNREEEPSFPWMKTLLYLYYESIELLSPYLQCFDFSFLLKNE
jgi:hypothetical protein